MRPHELSNPIIQPLPSYRLQCTYSVRNEQSYDIRQASPGLRPDKEYPSYF